MKRLTEKGPLTEIQERLIDIFKKDTLGMWDVLSDMIPAMTELPVAEMVAKARGQSLSLSGKTSDASRPSQSTRLTL